MVFACVRNGGRSVISRVLTEHYAQGRVVARSAGTQPGEHIHPEVADVLEKLGLDTSQETPDPADARDDRRFDDGDHARLRGGVPLRPRRAVRRLAGRRSRRSGRGDGASVIADLDARVRGLLVELVPDLELPPSVLVSGR